MNWFKTWLVKRQHATKFRIEYNNGELVMKKKLFAWLLLKSILNNGLIYYNATI